MSAQVRLVQRVSRLVQGILSAPIFIKVLGVGFLVALVFGFTTLYVTTTGMSRSLNQSLDQRTRSSVSWLAVLLERGMVTGDVLGVRKKIANAMEKIPDTRYIIVRARGGGVVAHTFRSGVPPDLDRLPHPKFERQVSILQLGSQEGRILDAQCPILEGYGGAVQLGVTDRQVNIEVSELTRSIVLGLATSAILGAALGLLLAYILTHPVHALVQTANRVGSGDFEARAEVYTGDEIGQLAGAFNRMADSLCSFRTEIEAQERERLLLVDRTVQAQEEERRNISRELHDELGQSLTALLLTVQSGIPAGLVGNQVREDVLGQISRLSGAVHRLAWDMRPAILDDYGLDSALSSYLDRVVKPAGLSIDYQYSFPPEFGRLPARVEVTLYRLTQEAITNVVRHANARHASVVVLHQGNATTLLIEDDGRGFDLEQLPGSKRLGLTGMKERVALLGGVFTVESRLGGGTTVWARIPVCKEGVECPSGS